jgi:hypothetical protein
MQGAGLITPVLGRSSPFRTPVIQGRQIEPDQIDYTLIKGWLDKEDKKPGFSIEGNNSEHRAVPIDLIDVHARYLVAEHTLSRPRFCALSYVWGAAGKTVDLLEEADTGNMSDIGDRRCIPRICSRTIEDAIFVTKSLGFDYLWVDAYCISKDPTIRHSQISQMDALYKLASLTIISAAGEDADYGLPGVSVPRTPQLNYSTEGDALVSIRLDVLDDFERSKYFTRAWTYQEQLFSERCLVFTPYQVYLDCFASIYLEMLSLPLQRKFQYHVPPWERHLHVPSRSPDGAKSYEIDGTLTPTNESPAYGQSQYRHLVSFQRHVEKYSRRNLTYEFDAINAIKAILERFEVGDSPLNNLWGIPIRYRGKPIFGFGLSWTHGFGITVADNLPKRRPMFPSWSWAGWTGGIRWLEGHDGTGRSLYRGCRSADEGIPDTLYKHSTLPCTRTKCTWYPEMEKSRDTRFSLTRTDSYPGLYVGGDPRPSQLLKVDAFLLQVEFELNENYLRAGFENFPMFRAPLHVTQWATNLLPHNFPHRLYASKTLHPLVAFKVAEKHPSSFGSTGPCEAHLLVITKPKSEGEPAERVGILKVPLYWYTEQVRYKEKSVFLLG